MAFANNMWGLNSTGFTDKFLSVNQVLKESGCDYHVESQPIFLNSGVEIPKHRANVRTDTGAVLGMTSNKYNILQNEEAFNFFQPFVDNKLAYIDNVGSILNGKITFIQAKVNQDIQEVTPGDGIENYIHIMNSFSGTTSVVVGYFPRRIFCSNQLPSLGASRHLRVKHTKNMNISLDKIRNVMSIADAEFKCTIEDYRFLASKGVSKDTLKKYVNLVFKPVKEDEEEQGEVRESIVEKIEVIFENGRGAKETPDSMYKLFNSVNEYLNYDIGRTAENRNLSLWNGVNGQTNNRSFQIAMDIASGRI